MKKIFILSHAMEIGGVERALLGLLENIDYGKYEVDLFLLSHTGEFLELIPPQVNILPADKKYSQILRPIKDLLKEGHFVLAASRLYGKFMAKVQEKRLYRHSNKVVDIASLYSHKYTYRFLPPIEENKVYDLAVSFLTPHYFVANKVKAKRKAAWIHTDYSAIDIDEKSEIKMWQQYDRIVAISENVSKNFAEKFPMLKDKLRLIRNILPQKAINEMAAINDISGMNAEKDTFALLSVGRFTQAKNFDNVPDICRRIIHQGIRVKWFLIGYGGQEQIIKDKIREAAMEDNVIVLGKKANPYPYMQKCDLYVQPSRFEGYCVAVREAQMLGKPVVITDYPTAPSQLEDGVDGVIVPMDNEGCAEGIVSLLRDKERMKRLSANCVKRDYTNSDEVKKLLDLIG